MQDKPESLPRLFETNKYTQLKYFQRTLHFHIVLPRETADTAITIIYVPPFPSIRQLQQS